MGVRALSSYKKRSQAILFIYNLLLSVVDPTRFTLSNSIDNINLTTVLKVAFAGFLRRKEFTYESTELQNLDSFKEFGLTRRDVTFAVNDSYAILRLCSSKANPERREVDIYLSATNDILYPVVALRNLLTLDPQSNSSPLFRFESKIFSRSNFMTAFRHRLQIIGVPSFDSFTGYSIRRGATQQASDLDLSENDIKALGH
ncbi:hypothetical protein SBOR_9470 [Sclerotinia borealis F-4128]|uniref:Uncharacterized protein n=1 Tax=Sclerotinia borealis (strain F-4128) TaxID=1432307 RepID=W9C340_SCLBF|nr:hypothetical protein SBOR_9470 [Sclerotinia borealis F-4128]